MGNTVQALNQWRHSLASSEALDVLHRAMHPTPYRYIATTIKIASDSPACVVVVDLLLPMAIAE